MLGNRLDYQAGDGGAYSPYNSTTSYAGTHTVKVRVKAANGNPAGPDTTLNFTDISIPNIPNPASVASDEVKTFDVVIPNLNLNFTSPGDVESNFTVNIITQTGALVYLSLIHVDYATNTLTIEYLGANGPDTQTNSYQLNLAGTTSNIFYVSRTPAP